MIIHKENIVWVLLILFLALQHAEAQTVEARKFTSLDGLSNNKVNAVFQDSRGFLWMGTNDGLNRYDGYEYVIYRHIPADSASIISNHIYCISEDTLTGNLWIGTNDGLSRFDPVTCRFKNYKIRQERPDRLSNRVYGILPASDGRVWLLMERELILFHPGRGEVKHFGFGTSGRLQPGIITRNVSLHRDRRGTVWIGMEDGLYRVDTAANVLHPTSVDTPVNNIVEMAPRVLWLGTDKGLCRYDPQTNSHVNHYREGPSSTPIFSMVNFSGNIWITGRGGVRVFDTQQQEYLSHRRVHYQGEPLEPGQPRCMIKDRKDMVWIGSYEGLFVFDLKPPLFRSMDARSGAGSLPDNLVSCILSDSRDRLWVGTWGGGIRVFQQGEYPLTLNVHPRLRDPGYPERYANVIYEDHQGRIWAAGRNAYIFDEAKDRMVDMMTYFRQPGGDRFYGRRIFDILQAGEGHMMFAHHEGIYHLYEQENRLEFDTVAVTGSGRVPLHMVTCLARDTGSVTWSGCFSGVYSYHLEEREYTHYPNDGSCGLHGRVYSMLVASDHTLWVGTGNGLYRLVKGEGRFVAYTVEDGLNNDFIYAIEEDNRGQIWVSTNMGISRMNPENGAFRNFSTDDGLLSMEFNLNASDFSSREVMYFGGIAGMNYFVPDSVRISDEQPAVAITGIKYFNRDKGDHQRYLNGQQITIGDDEAVHLRFSSLDFTNPRQNTYRYSLGKNGPGGAENNIGTENSVILSGLEHGEYTFRVWGTNSNGIWSNNPAELRINVVAPFYRQRFFLFVMLGLVLVLTGLFFEFRTRTLRRSNRILREKEVAAKEVLRQRNLLGRRNKNIEDSLKYAHRIQRAMFTTTREISSLFSENFVLQLPKDIVSGDFYWAKKIRNRIYLAAVDCTGHGVPGAFMSLIGTELFRQIVAGDEVQDPARVLNELNHNFNAIFGEIDDIALRDGMDLSLCVFNTETRSLDFAGAFNPVYIVRNNEIIEIKGDRIMVGPSAGFRQPDFTTHHIDLEQDDVIYLFSDGYADQFGGPEGKKFKYRRFRHLLLSLHHLPMQQQQKALYDSIREWRGETDQVDDILVIGVKPPW